MKHSWFRRSAVTAALVVVGLAVPLSPVSAAPGSWGDSGQVGAAVLFQGNAAIAVSADGSKALAVWEGPDHSVQTASATISGNVETWGSVTTLTSVGRRLAGYGFEADLSIALSDDGATATAVWIETNMSFENWQISSASASISGNTATWGSVASVSGAQVNDPVKVNYPQIKISADGTMATAVWLRRTGYGAASMSVESASAAISGSTPTWSSLSVIDGPYYITSPYTYTDPSLGLSNDGTKATVVWVHGDTSDYATVTSASATIGGSPANSASWSGVQSLSTSEKKVEAATVAVSSDGTKAVATWRMENSGSGTRAIQSAAATVSGSSASWGSVTPVDAGIFDAWDVHVTLSSDGTKVTVVWIGRTDGDDAVKSNSGTVSGTSITWGTPTLLTAPGHSGVYYVDIALSADGTVAFAFWTTSYGGIWNCSTAWAAVGGTAASWDPATDVPQDAGSYASVSRGALSHGGNRATMLCATQNLSNSEQTIHTRSYFAEVDGGGGGGSTTTTPATSAPPELPETGSNTSPVLPVALVLVGGAALLVARRRPNTSGA